MYCSTNISTYLFFKYVYLCNVLTLCTIPINKNVVKLNKLSSWSVDYIVKIR